MFNFAYVINPKCNKSYLPGVKLPDRYSMGGVIMCAVLHGDGGDMDFQNGGRKF